MHAGGTLGYMIVYFESILVILELANLNIFQECINLVQICHFCIFRTILQAHRKLSKIIVFIHVLEFPEST